MDFGSLFEAVREAPIFVQLGAVFLVSLLPFLEGYSAASFGILFGISAVPTILVASLGNWISIMAVVVLFDKLRKRNNKNNNGANKRMEKARKLFNKYGVPGVALIGPFVFGHHIGAFISLASGASRRYVTLWMTIGVLAWTIAVGLLAIVGVDLAGRLV